jgi:L-ascorbate metabolism protein UlaG (beta-lactamase superfamily)
MIIANLLRNTAAATCAILLVGCAAIAGADANNNRAATADTQAVKFQQIRNATIKVEYAGTTFLIDPMLGKKGAYPGFEGTYNSHLRNPLVELPVPVSEVMNADAVIVTHTHLDHWDEAAIRSLPKNIPIFAQNEEDAESIRKEGFENVRVLTANINFNGTRLSKTNGQHGSDAMLEGRGKRLGKSSGVVFQRPGYKTVYVAGDTVWNRYVEDAIRGYQPDVVILNACYGRLVGYDGAFIMGKEDLYRAYEAAPKAKVIASHMESIAHCMQPRKELRDYIAEKGMSPQRVLVPEDGESYSF